MNKVILIGRLVKDAELRYTKSNVPVATFTIAVSRKYASKDGVNEVDYINCMIWQKPAENLKKYVGKGDQVAVIGRLQVRNYEDNNGKKHYVTEVVCENVTYLNTSKKNKTEKLSVSYEESNTKEITNPYEEMGKQVEADFSEELPFD